MRGFLVFAAMATALPSHAIAQERIALTSAVYVETMGPGGTGRSIQPAATLQRGDRIVMMIRWSGAEARRKTVVRSAIPTDLQYQRSSSEAVEVSVDGGRKWGRIGELKIGNRLAAPEEVTHIRLRVSGNHSGQLTYSAIVR